MRSRIGLLAAAGLLGGVLLAGGSARAQIDLNGRQVAYQAPVFTTGQYLMVPLRETLDALGVQGVAWQSGGREVSFTHNGSTFQIRQMSGYAIVNGQGVVMGAPAVLRNDRLYVPLSFLREQMGVSVAVAPETIAPGVRSRVLGFRGSPTVERPGIIAIGGVTLFRVDTPGEFPSVADRATNITERLNSALQRIDPDRFRAGQVTWGYAGGRPMISLAGTPLVTVTEADAAASNSSMDVLAVRWLGQIRTNLRRVYAP